MREFNKVSQFWEDLKTGRFAQMVRETTKGQEISNEIVAYHILKPLFAEQDDVESVYFIFLDGQNHILAIEKLFSGTLNSSNVYPREIVKRVLALKAGAAIMSHNHPGGNTKPSNEDLTMTLKIIFSLLAIDVPLHDHIIVGDGYFSMSSNGWIQSTAD